MSHFLTLTKSEQKIQLQCMFSLSFFDSSTGLSIKSKPFKINIILPIVLVLVSSHISFEYRLVYHQIDQLLTVIKIDKAKRVK